FFYRRPTPPPPSSPAETQSVPPPTASASASLLTPLSIPGPDPSLWAMPRFLFLTLPHAWAEHASAVMAAASRAREAREARMMQAHAHAGEREGPEGEQKKGGKARVMALPNLFVAASERGWVGKDAARGAHAHAHADVDVVGPAGGAAEGKGTGTGTGTGKANAPRAAVAVPDRLARQTQWGNVPFGRAVLSLRSRER
ncbi:hypothetical protein OC834_007035, partial [Tilletia horrida]